MSAEFGRIARFVSAARNLLLLQVLAALLAVGFAAWAFVEVRGLAEERDRLRARVAELEAQGGAMLPVGPAVPLGPEPAYNQILPTGTPPDLNMIVPPAVAPDVNGIAPALPVARPPAPVAEEEPEGAEPEPANPVRRWDCSGLNAQNPRCRPLMERPNLPLNKLEPRGPALGPRGDPPGNQQGPAG
jgi:hypothetical protein